VEKAKYQVEGLIETKMYHPNLTRTDRIVNLIAEISASREVILNASLLPKWDLKLRKEAILKMAHHSTSIEGNPLTLKQVEDLLAGKPVAARDVDKREVLNYVKVLEYIDKLGKGKREITEDVILRIHKINTDAILDREKSGHYRKVPVAVVNSYGRVVFQPPKVKDVPKLMSDFVEWLNSKEAVNIYPVLEAGIAHYEFVRIHPFVDGNGRTARALATLILYLQGFDTKRFFALDDYYNEDRSRYYAALQTVDPKTIDITKWLEYFTEGVAVSMAGVKETILDFSLDKRLRDKKGQIFLNDRQMKILKHLQTNPRITNRECRKLTGLSDEGVRKELNFLIRHGLIKVKGSGRGTHYILVGD